MIPHGLNIQLFHIIGFCLKTKRKMLRFGCKTASSQFAYTCIFLKMEFGDKFKI